MRNEEITDWQKDGRFDNFYYSPSTNLVKRYFRKGVYILIDADEYIKNKEDKNKIDKKIKELEKDVSNFKNSQEDIESSRNEISKLEDEKKKLDNELIEKSKSGSEDIEGTKSKIPENVPEDLKEEFVNNPNFEALNFQEWLDENHPDQYKDLYEESSDLSKSQMEEYSYNEDVQSLGDELGIDYEDIEQEDENSFITSDGAEYVVYDDNEADGATREYIESTIDDMGLEAFSSNFQEWIIDNALDESWFREAMEESNEYYVQDLENESSSQFGNRLIEEAYNAGVIGDDDFELDEDNSPIFDSLIKDEYELHDEYVEYLNNSEDNPVEWYRNNLGDEDLTDLIRDNRIDLDIDAIVEECIAEDGRGHFLSTYDGEEIELNNGKYAYRIN